MKDMMMEVYDSLILNDIILKNVTKERIKFYEVPESFDTLKPFIIIDTPLGPPMSSLYASNQELSQEFNYQINVESSNRLLTKKIAKAVKKVMWEIGFGQLSGGLDEYFSETKRFVDARRYRKNTEIFNNDY
ncbi:hypothetical protein ACG6P0_002665 [Enterococcus hirae]|uniref:hypothetical protein n=1 Tax=Enterococcus hirae TaxID=1354 RepID=UPI001A064CE1|nr:hypothetical protein [Enterococcus hirae]EMF0045323.1 hypothetical protein [Enterococcus hirae]EMF0058020.1 hypothetical protein [Enterococcus hirae]EMF0113363.1 hypothetical protein [Enterococcus hirae]EMF0120789.1 hypothetical protein [Enterococcus hirae]EMF0134140.1 hypothetical protein [Enterococcus hirae]